jgi:mannosylglycerate hydrolase
MAARVKKSRASSNKKQSQRIQCHVVSSTHWDREWRVSFQKTRYRLVYMMDMLLDIFEKEPQYKSYFLDSQTSPLVDYLEMRPEKADILRKYIKEKRLFVGPWFTLPEESSLGSGEALIRNLLLGCKIARSFGGVSKTGYNPFSFGQISQMPQIYRGFGINFVAFYRGINKRMAPRSEAFWESPDGSRILMSRLGAGARTHFFYTVQKPVFWNEGDGEYTMSNRDIPWNRGYAPFKLINAALANRDGQYAHPPFEYHPERINELAHKIIADQNDDWTTQHRIWLVGEDVSWPDVREIRLLEDCKEALKDIADVFPSTFVEFQKNILECASPDLPVVKGEMRHSFTTGSTGSLIGEVISARMPVKQENFRTERDIISLAEPATVFAALLGAPYQGTFVDMAYNLLLQSHGHDSIGCCSRDAIADDMMNRFRQSRDISDCVLESAMREIAGSIDLSKRKKEDVAVVVYNPTPFKRTEVMPVRLEIPREWQSSDIELVDENGNSIPVQISKRVPRHFIAMKEPNNSLEGIAMDRYDVEAQFVDVPSYGYSTFFAKQGTGALQQPKTMRTAPQTMENEFLAATINSNGTLDVHEKQTGRIFKNLGYFSDASEIGDAWTHKAAQGEAVFTTLNEQAQIVLLEDGELKTSFRITLNWSLPECCTKDLYLSARSTKLKPYQIINTVTLRKGHPWVEIVTELDNDVLDHYLQVVFPTNLKTDSVMAQGHFDVVHRSFKMPDYSLYEEEPQLSKPMNSFIDVSDGTAGLALLNEGLKAYEAHDDPARTVSLALLRCFPKMFCVENFWDRDKYTGRFTRPEDTGMQCPGKHRFRYGIMPHPQTWDKADVWKASERFNLDLIASQIGPTEKGHGPLAKSFLELAPDNLHVSAVKRAEDNSGWIVRLFNPFDRTISARIRLNGGLGGPLNIQSPLERQNAEYALPGSKGRKWNKVRLVTLEELPEKDLKIDAKGWSEFEITKKKIVTIKFLP